MTRWSAAPRQLVGPPGALRLWIRAAVRRPTRGALVVVGLLATALVTTAALVAGDSLETLFTADALATWGEVDIVVRSPGGALMEESAGRYVAVEGGEKARAFANRLILPTVATAGERREPRAVVAGLGPEEQTFTGQVGDYLTARLSREQVMVNARLAERLGVAAGDRLQLVVAVPLIVEIDSSGRETERIEAHAAPWDVTVVAVLPDTGVADLGRTANVLARLDVLQSITGVGGRSSGLHVAARQAGAEASEALSEDLDDTATLFGMGAVEVKEEALETAREEGGLFRGILLTLALLVVAAASAVTVNLLRLLGEERRMELAVLRAVGARANAVERLLVAEGFVYAVVAAVLGALLGVPLASLLAGRLADSFAALELGRGREQVALPLGARPATVVVGVLVVLVVSTLTVRSAARRLGRMDVASVLRGGPTGVDAVPTSSRRPRLASGIGLFLLGAGTTASDGADALRFLGLSLLLAAWWLRRRRSSADPPALDRRAAAWGLGWCLAGPAVLGDFSQGVQSGFGVLAAAGAGAVGCAAALAVRRLRAIMRFVRGYLPAGRWQASLRTAGAQAEHDARRSGTVLAAVAVVLFMVAALAVLGSATAIPPQRQAGGFDVVATAAAPVDPMALQEADVPGDLVTLSHAVIPETAYTVEDDDNDETSTLVYPVRLIEATSAFASTQGYGLATALPQYADSVAALDAVVGGEDKAVVDRYARPEGAQPGDEVQIDLGGGVKRFELVAVLDTFVLGGVLVGPNAFDKLVADKGPTLILGTGRRGAGPTDLAIALEDAGADRGVIADTISEAAAAVVATNRQFTDVFALLLQLGLAVALAAVGTLVSRGLRERRAQFGVLRSLGLRRADVRRTLLAEPMLVATTGVVVGTAVGLTVLRLLFAVGFADLAFVVDWRRLGLTILGTELLVLLVCIAPAALGARRPPDEALRDLG